MAERIAIITETNKTLKVVIAAGATGRKKPTAPLKLGALVAIRQVDVNANSHNANNSTTVTAGQHTLIDQLPDLQSYSTSAHNDPENANKVDRDAEINAVIDVQTAYSVETTFAITVTYWVIEYLEA